MVENKLNELPEKVKLVSTKGLIEDLRNKYSILIVQKKNWGHFTKFVEI